MREVLGTSLRCSTMFLSSIYHFLRGPNPLDPGAWRGHLSPGIFRGFTLQDLPQCLELYALNEPGRFPPNGRKYYEAHLRKQAAYYLVAEADGQLVACGGISYYMQPNVAVLSYGLVRPSHHGQGI